MEKINHGYCQRPWNQKTGGDHIAVATKYASRHPKFLKLGVKSVTIRKTIIKDSWLSPLTNLALVLVNRYIKRCIVLMLKLWLCKERACCKSLSFIIPLPLPSTAWKQATTLGSVLGGMLIGSAVRRDYHIHLPEHTSQKQLCTH